MDVDMLSKAWETVSRVYFRRDGAHLVTCCVVRVKPSLSGPPYKQPHVFAKDSQQLPRAATTLSDAVVTCCILSQYRGSFHVSIGFGLGLLRRHEVLAWYAPPRRVDAWLAYRILCAGLVPVNDLGIQAYEYYCRVGGMVSRVS